MSDVIAMRASLEERSIAILGYACRDFQEDNNLRGSWAYTVGLKKDDRNICLFARAGVEADILNGIIADIAPAVSVEGPMQGVFNIPDTTLGDTATKIRFKLRRVKPDVIEAIKGKLGNYIEGQAPDTEYYWILIADANNILPGEEGYTDFLQLGNAVNPDDPMSSALLIEEFEEFD